LEQFSLNRLRLNLLQSIPCEAIQGTLRARYERDKLVVF
jgi:hypothetical protein